jgi:hypothetical protein
MIRLAWVRAWRVGIGLLALARLASTQKAAPALASCDSLISPVRNATYSAAKRCQMALAGVRMAGSRLARRGSA